MLHVVVLAAGRSARMGFPKALVRIDGEFALARVLRIARDHALPTRVVLGFHAEAIRASVALADDEVVMNPAPERGQTSSLRAGAAALPAGSALAIWPVDHAHVAAATFAALVARFNARAPAIGLVAPSHAGRRGHPLLVNDVVRREFAVLRDDEPAHVVVRRDARRVEHVVVDDPAVLRDFDRPGDVPSAPPDARSTPGATPTPEADE